MRGSRLEPDFSLKDSPPEPFEDLNSEIFNIESLSSAAFSQVQYVFAFLYFEQ
jgi:hypothetical protein